MLGETDPLFRDLARCRALRQAAEVLTAATAEGTA
jgi:hypothetical protein